MKMSKFKVGDEVRVKKDPHFMIGRRSVECTDLEEGDVFRINHIYADGDLAAEEGVVSPEYVERVDGELGGAGAVKHDSDKPDLTLVSYHGMAAIARALMYGVEKYGRDNYRKPPRLDRLRLLGSAMRHLALAVIPGKELDDESGLPHTYHAAAALCMLHDGEEVK